MADSDSSPSPESGNAPPRRKALGAVFVTIFLDLVGFSIIFPLFPAMLDHYLPKEGEGSLFGQFIGALQGLADSAAASTGADPRFLAAVLFGGILGSVYSLLQFVFSPIWGHLSDRRGRRAVLTLTLAGTALSYLVWVFAGSFWLLVLSRLLGGVMAGNLAVATAAVADVTSEENRSKGMALVGIAFGMGFIVGPAIGGFGSLLDLTVHFPALTAIGLNPFSAPALFALVLSVGNFFWMRARLEETRPPEKIAETTARPEGRLRRIFHLQDKRIRQAILIYGIFILAFSGMEFTLTFLAVERLAYSPAQMTWIFVFIGFVLIMVQGGLVRRLAPKVGEKPLAVAGIASGSVAFSLLAMADSAGLFYTGLLLMGLAIGLANPTLTGLVSLYSPDDEQGKNLGAFRAAGSLSRAAGPLIAACLFWRFGSQVSYLTGGGIVLASLLLALLLPAARKTS